MNFSCIDEVEHLHHHKGIENEGEMARRSIVFLQNFSVVLVTAGNEIFTAASDPS